MNDIVIFKEVMIINLDFERIKQLQNMINELISEIEELCGEVPSVSRNLEMIKADVAVLKHSTMVD